MLQKLKSLLFDGDTSAARSAGRDDVALAAAAVMVEAATLDGTFDDTERASILRLLGRRFSLSDADARALLAEAEAEVAETTELYAYTRAIKDRFDHEQRIEMVEMLWEVVYADGQVHDYEANLMRRICGLLYVEDAESGDARKRVMQRLGLSS
ncbi:TerB family tellurite resistance protein [Caenispirillum bisanense]|uniref:Uncharacterized conserved protein, tellurite resistance protein B (TerB) family n=1 Tax=Caenispirillum bisanense TaxID=414052 RepID=A0A286GXM5_9PROT|nr:TerB family tellurite resistance protein [Caenispirillum bisanense]SOD99824.1 Uncharacterized conserved protein, tellurite resistance protein B (TerB) family [Caenispirillum bisanense]